MTTALPNFSLRKCPKPVLDVNGGFLTANQLEDDSSKLPIKERMARIADATQFLNEAKQGRWWVNQSSVYWLRKENLKYWHFKDEDAEDKEK